MTISTVAVNAHGTAESQNLADIARDGQGKYYSVNNPNKALPRIFQKEARRVSRPLIYPGGDPEASPFFPVKQVTEHEMMLGIKRVAADPRLRAHEQEGQPLGGDRASGHEAGRR